MTIVALFLGLLVGALGFGGWLLAPTFKTGWWQR